MLKKELFLDLEGTLVKEWCDPTPLHCNINIIKEFIIANEIKKATMFSLAIIDEKDNAKFNLGMKQRLENLLDIDIEVVCIKEVFNLIVKNKKIIGTFDEWHDIFLFNAKETAFEEWIVAQKLIFNTEFILFDDVVANKDVFLRDRNVKITFNKI